MGCDAQLVGMQIERRMSGGEWLGLNVWGQIVRGKC